ncbi:MAG: hypothetical protein S4CHLAM107_15950 [Chlamydiia bacterium]|nr:hypothetical protein [Chlamydiia bacterium]
MFPPSPARGPQLELSTLHDMFGVTGSETTENKNREMLVKAEQAATWAGALRTTTLIIGAALTVGSVVAMSAFFTTVGVVVGLGIMALGQTMHELNAPVQAALNIVRVVSLTTDNEDDRIDTARLSPFLLTMKAAYDVARQNALIPVPRLQDLPMVGEIFTALQLPTFTPAQLQAFSQAASGLNTGPSIRIDASALSGRMGMPPGFPPSGMPPGFPPSGMPPPRPPASARPSDYTPIYSHDGFDQYGVDNDGYNRSGQFVGLPQEYEAY